MFFDGLATQRGVGARVVINQLLSTYEVGKPELLLYRNYAKKLDGWFLEITHKVRKKSAQANTEENLASSLNLVDKEVSVRLYHAWVIQPISNKEVKVGNDKVNSYPTIMWKIKT
ncbi:hypothetical protein MLD38_018852 [Melastoma candidum]|uniref:Uncharacterized protein n=1 Tax=Melastoma candidum TaxID=119954 RepID=A0ACB9QWF2_9MYRT|nr:hypothetical protein MLD38_018852 [Melastoma candidum]